MFYLARAFAMCTSSVVLVLLQALLFLRSTDCEHAGSCSMEDHQPSLMASNGVYLKCGIRAFNPSGRGYRRKENVSVLPGGRTMDKIIGGSHTVYGEIPWQASVRTAGRINDRLVYRHSCGAVIVSEFWLLSAAHCYFGKDPGSLRAVVGDHHLHRKDREQMFELDKIIVHELFKYPQHKYDIALVKIKPANNGRGIRFNDVVQPICLPASTEHPTNGTELLISGWGRYSTSGSEPSEVLQQTLLPVVSLEDCKKLLRLDFTDHMVCAGHVNGHTDLCRGDSGGPAVYKSREIYILYGIVSFGTGCPLPHYPAVLTSVPVFRSWIESNIIGHSDNDLQRIIPGRPFINE